MNFLKLPNDSVTSDKRLRSELFYVFVVIVAKEFLMQMRFPEN